MVALIIFVTLYTLVILRFLRFIILYLVEQKFSETSKNRIDFSTLLDKHTGYVQLVMPVSHLYLALSIFYAVGKKETFFCHRY